MIFYYVRHGDPIYNPDSLTAFGHEQAAALAKRFALHGLDKIYVSSSNRAIQTSRPTCEALGIEADVLDWCNEGHAWSELSIVDENDNRMWLFQHHKTALLFSSPEIRRLDREWYSHPSFDSEKCKKGMDRIQRESDAFMASLGFEHDIENACYKVTRENNERVALFAHQGFGLAFLSALLDVPYPLLSTRFDHGHTGVTAIKLDGKVGESVIPTVLQLSNDSHLYKEGLSTKYQNVIQL